MPPRKCDRTFKLSLPAELTLVVTRFERTYHKVELWTAGGRQHNKCLKTVVVHVVHRYHVLQDHTCKKMLWNDIWYVSWNKCICGKGNFIKHLRSVAFKLSQSISLISLEAFGSERTFCHCFSSEIKGPDLNGEARNIRYL